MDARLNDARVFLYSHDTFGLGHLRRCRTIAHELVDRYKGLRVLIVSGSPIIASFDFKARVDFVRVPGVIKLRNGNYTSLDKHIDLEQTLEMRASIIRTAAETFNPDIFIVDKEPLGLRGEIADTLADMHARGVYCVLGLRDILDDPAVVQDDWRRRSLEQVVRQYYDEIWVYGHKAMGHPLAGLDIDPATEQKITFTGYLRRSVPDFGQASDTTPDAPYVLVTTGGGGDGRDLVDWVLRAYEASPEITISALVVLGPFMPLSDRTLFESRTESLGRVDVITFDSHPEPLMQGAAGVIAMGGYNTFCEILSFNKRAVLVPRSVPRLEQVLRAERAAGLGLVSYLDGESSRPAEVMVDALNRLPQQRVPLDAGIQSLLSGLDTVADRVREILAYDRPEMVATRG